MAAKEGQVVQGNVVAQAEEDLLGCGALQDVVAHLVNVITVTWHLVLWTTCRDYSELERIPRDLKNDTNLNAQHLKSHLTILVLGSSMVLLDVMACLTQGPIT